MMIIKPSIFRLTIFFAVALWCCHGCVGQPALEEKAFEASDGSSIYLADPTIFVHEGSYYLYGTDGEQPDRGFKVYTSENLEDWEGPLGVDDGFALIKDNVYGDKGFWAPQVWFENDLFYMAYTANENIAIATSESPIGPFVQENKVPIIQDGKQIDPFVFTDTDGKKYLYHVKLQEGNRIFVAELHDDYSQIDATTLTECLHVTLPWENTDQSAWPVAEGPTIIKEGQHYYMFYSANDFRNPDYAVGLAVSENVYGPWEKLSDTPLLSRIHTNWPGTGHGDVFQADNGQWHYVCHTHFSAEKVSPRRTALVPFVLDTAEPESPVEMDVAQFRLLTVAEQGD